MSKNAKVVYISNTDENADWIKWRTNDVIPIPIKGKTEKKVAAKEKGWLYPHRKD